MKPSGPKVYFVQMVLLTNSVSFEDRGLFRVSVPSCLSCAKFAFSGALSIKPKFSNFIHMQLLPAFRLFRVLYVEYGCGWHSLYLQYQECMSLFLDQFRVQPSQFCSSSQITKSWHCWMLLLLICFLFPGFLLLSCYLIPLLCVSSFGFHRWKVRSSILDLSSFLYKHLRLFIFLKYCLSW